MTLKQFVSRFSLLTFLLCTGCHSSVVTDNSMLIDKVSPGNAPWMVYFRSSPSRLRCMGSLITDEWVLTDEICATSKTINNIEAVLGIRNRTGDNPNTVNRTLVDLVCKRENKDWSDSGICLVKLSSPVNFTDDIQAIPLASNMSTFDNGTAAWASGFEIIGDELISVINRVMDVEGSILNNDECKLELPYSITKTEMCVTLRGADACQVVPASPVVSNERRQWILLGVYIFRFLHCKEPVVFTRVSLYQDWIREVITGMEPTFVTVSSTGTDPDENSSSSGEISTTTIGMTTSTFTPNTTTTVDPTGMGTRSSRTTTTGMTAVIPTTPDRSVFSGSDMIHFTHFYSLSALVLFLHVLVCDSEM